jgi:hypothetical protein
MNFIKKNKNYDYDMTFIPDNQKLIDDFNKIKEIHQKYVSVENMEALEKFINNDKYYLFSKELIKIILSKKINLSDKDDQDIVFRLLKEKADLFFLLQDKDIKLSNSEVFNLVYWVKYNDDLNRLKKDIENISIKSIKKFNFMRIFHTSKDIGLGISIIAAIIITLILGLKSFILLNESYTKNFETEKISLMKNKEKEYTDIFNPNVDEYHPKNKYRKNVVFHINSTIELYKKFEPVIKYKQENTNKNNHYFIKKLDNKLLKNKKIKLENIEEYMLQINNHDKLLEIKNKNITPENTQLFKYSEKLITSDLIITEEELNILKEIK